MVTGNTVIDALLATVDKQLPFTDPRLEELAASGRRILLVTTHRRENQGDAMRNMGRALARIADAEPELTIVLPAHKNPVVREAVLPALEGKANVLVTEPLAYGEFTRLLSRGPHRVDGLRRRAGGSAQPRQAGPGDAGKHRAARGCARPGPCC